MPGFGRKGRPRRSAGVTRGAWGWASRRATAARRWSARRRAARTSRRCRAGSGRRAGGASPRHPPRRARAGSAGWCRAGPRGDGNRRGRNPRRTGGATAADSRGVSTHRSPASSARVSTSRSASGWPSGSTAATGSRSTTSEARSSMSGGRLSPASRLPSRTPPTRPAILASSASSVSPRWRTANVRGTFREPIPGSSAGALVNAGSEASLRAAALELPRGVRLNVVSPAG